MNAPAPWYRELKSHPLRWKIALIILALAICLFLAVRSVSEQGNVSRSNAAQRDRVSSRHSLDSNTVAAARTAKPTAGTPSVSAPSLAPHSSLLAPSANDTPSLGQSERADSPQRGPLAAPLNSSTEKSTPTKNRVTIHKSDAPASDDSPVRTSAEVRPEDVLRALDRSVSNDIGSLTTSSPTYSSTSLFGLEAEGRRFVYVFDRSASMSEPDNKPLRAAQAELIRSIRKLDGVHQFFLVFYNHEPKVFNPSGVSGRLVFATDENKKSAERFIDEIRPEGGTKHYPALMIAARLRPDVIYLLTDGEQKDDLTGDELSHLKRLNDGIAQIHVVQFAGTPHSNNSLAELAKTNRGQHLYLDVRKLAGQAK